MHRPVLTFGVIASIVAVVRFFLKGLLEPIGVPTYIGSFLASITIVLLIGTIVIFMRAGKDPDGRYLPAAGRCFLLSVWCQALIIGGILVTEWTQTNTYYSGPWEMIKEQFPTAHAHVIGHSQGFWVLTAVLLIIGGVTYAISRRSRRLAATSA